MPRVRNSGRNVDAWATRSGKPVSNWDVCTKCLRHHGRHGLAGLLPPYNGDPQGYGGVIRDQTKFSTYTNNSTLKCAVCASLLGEGDT